MKENRKYKNFKQIANIFYNEELEVLNDKDISEVKNKGSVRIEPRIIFDKFSGDMKVEFRIGNKKMYKIKDLAEFYDRMMNEEFYRYGEKLQFKHVKESFDEESQNVLKFLIKHAEIIRIANSNSNNNFRYYGKVLDESSIIVGNTGLDDLFESLKGRTIQFQKNTKLDSIEMVDENPLIDFTLTKKSDDEYVITPNIEIFKLTIIRGKKYKYVLKKDKLYRCTKEFERNNLKLLELYRQNYMTEVTLGKNELSELFSIVIPRVKDAITIENMSKEELEQYQPEELITKVFLDFDKNGYIIADVKFCYGEREFNPLDESVKIDFPRNIIKETKNLNVFKKTGFMFDAKNLRFILPNDDFIYNFLSEEINEYMQKFDLLVTENFKTKEIRQPKIGNVGVKIENELLKIDLKNLNINPEELDKILERYKLKKKYYRLKTGEFISLTDNKEVDFLEKLISGMNISYEELKSGEIEVPVYRTLYLNELLKKIKGTAITKNDEYRKVVDNLNKDNIEEEFDVPKSLESVLRFYQKTGFKWLKVLDNYKFGGILADDMGLGKTIQMLSIIVAYIESYNKDIIEGQEVIEVGDKKGKRASLVISPSSLTLNWKSEAEKFTNELKTLVIRGTAQERKRQINEIDKYDLVITSYDLLKRDIEIYKEKDYQFRFVIADEAQYLKNSNTQNAKSIKEIKADTRYALTGTPIENSLAELWSIFDFIMSGYLFTYKKFKESYEVPIVKNQDEKAMEKLKMLIQPFVLRRTKTEVLTELPEKTITVLDNEMEEEQRNIYLTYLAQAKKEVAQEIDSSGYQKSQMKILAALTRLRQICCHPNLFLENYKGSSSKLEQCMEIVEDAISGGHKILLFSSYTSMFDIIEKKFKEKDIKYFKLTGSTKVEERLDLVDEFNTNKDVKVFLISLKAGGTGLNLTGADMVIHYDPWWNLSAENQATDRAYRIGQKNNVQVYKLITKNTIEEKIYKLQQRKAELIDNMLDTQTIFANKLSKADIMQLFE